MNLVTVSLTDGALACLACGVAVQHPQAESVQKLQPVEREHPPGEPRGRLATAAPPEVAVTLCPTCAVTHSRAVALVVEHPRVAQRIGSRSVAMHRIVSALDALAALAALGTRVQSADALTRTDDDLVGLLAHLSSPGASARWSFRFAPVTERGADPSAAALSPWGHLTEVQAGVLRDAYAALLASRIEPRPVAPPPFVDGDDEVPAPRGCLMCGIGAVVSGTRDVWAVAAPTPSALGGHGAERVRGYLCPLCADAVREAESIGPTAMERALLTHLQVRSGRMSALELVGLRGWAITGRRQPNPTPWAHVAGLADLADELRTTSCPPHDQGFCG